MTEETNLGQGSQPSSAALPATQQLLAASRSELGRVIAGQSDVIGEVLVAVLTQGHALLEGVPGIAKTLIVKSVGRLLGLGFQRVQGTPDLMPADILGTTMFRPGTDTFTFHAGPVFTDLLLVDEINRMPPRTQAALLECMEERQVTSDGVQRPLPPWFTVFATENPIDFEGTYPLPEAQLDRFLLKIKVSYPAPDDERLMLERHHGAAQENLLEDAKIQPLSAHLLAAARDGFQALPILDADEASAKGQDATLRQTREHTREGFFRGAEHLGHGRLADGHGNRAAGLDRQAEDITGETGRYFLEGEIGQGITHVAEPGDQCAHDLETEVRVAQQELAEPVLLNGNDGARTKRLRRRGICVHEYGRLGERLAGFDHVKHPFASVRANPKYLHRPAGDEKKTARQLALAENGLALPILLA